MHCLNERVQKTEQLARLLRPSLTGIALRILAVILTIAAVSARAGEPIKVLAMVNHHQPLAESRVSVQTNFLTSSDNLLLDFKTNIPAISGQKNEAAAEFSAEMRLEKLVKSESRDSLQLIHENVPSSSRSNVIFSVQAGYERTWDEKSMLSKICDGYQQPGCAYVSANFSF